MKATALLEAVGIKSVEEKKLNLNANSDTLLPKLFIKLLDFKYDKLQINTAVEIYDFELIFIRADSDNPISDLKTLIDNFLNNLFNGNELFTKLSQNGKIRLLKCDVSNDRDIYSKFGGEHASLKMEITNVNSFGGNSCL